MELQRVTLESSPAYVLLCFAIALALTYLLYKAAHPWNKTWNYVLSATRFILLFLLVFLLLGPIVQQITNRIEKPVLVIMHDNSSSVRLGNDSSTIRQLHNKLDDASKQFSANGYDVKMVDLTGQDITKVNYKGNVTDLNAALKSISYRFEGKKIAGVILTSDGIFNKGLSPLFANYNFPVHSVGLGDSIERTDIGIRNVSYNRIAYQGNKFPVRVEVLTKNLPNEPVSVTIRQGGKVIDKQSKTNKDGELLTFDFYPQAQEEGIQKLDIEVDKKADESNTRNNRATAFVEVVAGKKKILIIASAPHPDLKAIREVIEKNANYESHIHIPGTKEADPALLEPSKVDLVIFHQSPDIRGRTRALFERFLNSKTSLFLIIGQQTDLRALSKANLPLQFEAMPRDFDQVTPVVNPSFGSFTITPESNSTMADYPPASVHFGRMKISMSATPLLFQRVGNLATDKPMLVVEQQEIRRTAVLLGEGLWRWRLNEFDRLEKTDAFDELFGKLIQYLSTSEDKRKFRSNPVQQEFSDTDPVTFESQVYNDLFEPVYGNTITISIVDDSGKRSEFNYVTSEGNSEYQIGGLREGVYRYRSSTTINGKTEETRGQFSVQARNDELLNLTADFGLLRNLSKNTGGEFIPADRVDTLTSRLARTDASGVIHSEETYNSLINLKWVFWLLVALISLEWFARKFFGSY